MVRRRRGLAVGRVPPAQDGGHGGGGRGGHGRGVAVPAAVAGQRSQVRVELGVDLALRVDDRVLGPLVPHDHHDRAGLTGLVELDRAHLVVAEEIADRGGEEERPEEQQRADGEVGEGLAHGGPAVGQKGQRGGDGGQHGEQDAVGDVSGLQRLEHEEADEDDHEPDVEDLARRGVDGPDHGLDGPQRQGRPEGDDQRERDDVGLSGVVDDEGLGGSTEDVEEGLGHRQARHRQELEERAHGHAPLEPLVSPRRSSSPHGRPQANDGGILDQRSVNLL